MPFSSETSSRAPMYTFPILFDTSKNRLSVATFNEISEQQLRLLEGFGKELLSDELQIRTFVLPPEAGSFKAIFGAVLFVSGTVWAFLESDVGSGFILGLTEKTPSEISEELGKQVRDFIADQRTENAERISEEDVEAIENNGIACAILVEAGMKFLEKSTTELEALGIVPDEMPTSFEAKNNFFDACERDPNIRSVSFGSSRPRPVKRDTFPTRIVKLIDNDDGEWEFLTSRFHVTSPNWDRLDKRRAWKGRDANGSVRYFHIVDDNFWDAHADNLLKPATIDEVIAQVAVKKVDGRVRQTLALNVIAFNGENISAEQKQRQLKDTLQDALGLDLREPENDLFYFDEDGDDSLIEPS